MRKVTVDFLNKKKVEILDGATWLPETERAEFFSELADWAYAKYEAMSIDDKCEINKAMKENLKKATKYFAQILFVVLFAPIILVKAIMDPVLQMLIALVHALFGDSEASNNALKDVLNKID